jgi:hypothetical protein
MALFSEPDSKKSKNYWFKHKYLRLTTTMEVYMDKETECFIKGLTQADAAQLFKQALGERKEGQNTFKTESYANWKQMAEMMQQIVIDEVPHRGVGLTHKQHNALNKVVKPVLTKANLQFAFALEKFYTKQLW